MLGAILEKNEKTLFYIFLFLIPFQIRTTIWGPPAGGEWGSVFLYLTDLLLIGFLFFGFINKRILFKKTDILLFLFLALSGISIFASSDSGAGIYRFIKLLEFVLLYIYIKNNPEKFWRPAKINGVSVLLVSGVFQAILATAQFFKQSSLGLKFIEAGKYFPGAPGVATFLMGDDKVMRAYGSFLHPNVLAGFLLLAIFCFYALWIKNRIKPIFMIGFFVLVFGLFVTFSRESIFTFLFISFVFLLARFFQLRRLEHTEERLLAGKKLMILALFFVVFSLVSSLILLPQVKTRFFGFSLKEEAVDLRFFYNKMAIQIIKEKPVLGIGIGNFVNYSHNYPAFLRAAAKMAGTDNEMIPIWIFQPVHNIYLLIASEIGIFGLLFFVLFILIKVFKSIKPIKPKELFDVIGPMPFLFIAFLIIGLSDHYFWTLQSGGIIFWLSLALAKKE